MSGSLCDRCSKPGRCCSDFLLSLQIPAGDDWKDRAKTLVEGYGIKHFIPIEAVRGPWTPDDRVQFRCNCSLIGADGRCMDYENRPAVCRVFEPGTDALCVEFIGPPPERPKHVAY